MFIIPDIGCCTGWLEKRGIYTTYMMDVTWLLGGLLYLFATFLILGWIIHKKSCEGISGKMQVLYAIAFTARFMDVFYGVYYNVDYYIIFLKIFFILLSYITVFLIYVVYKKTYEKDYDLFWIETLIILCLGLGLLLTYDITMPESVLWAFSYYLEAVTFIPQLYFTYKKEIKSNIITYYVIALILSRAFYIAHRSLNNPFFSPYDDYLFYAELVQFFLYFAYFILPRGNKDEAILPTVTTEVPPVPTLSLTPKSPRIARSPNLARQESLLETPFLKRNAASYSSVYTVASDSKNTSPTGSVTSLNGVTNQEAKL